MPSQILWHRRLRCVNIEPIINGVTSSFLTTFASKVYSYWRVAPLEFFIWLAAVLVTIFSSIENGIYTSIASSLVLLLLRLAHPRGTFLGKAIIRGSSDKGIREVFLPLEDKKKGIVNPAVKVYPPSPGVIIYRFEESYLYPNISILNSILVDYVRGQMR